jgi:hypothetical protein
MDDHELTGGGVITACSEHYAYETGTKKATSNIVSRTFHMLNIMDM